MDWNNWDSTSSHANVLSESVDVHRAAPDSSPLVFINLSNTSNVKTSAVGQKVPMSRWAVLNPCRSSPRVKGSSNLIKASRSATPVDSDVKPRLRKKRYSDVFNSPPLGSPTELVGAASRDPFESLPLTIDKPTWHLLNYWLDARGWGPAQEAYRHQVSAIRKALCFPLIASSPVTMTAAIALIEQTVHPEASHSTLVTRLSQALPELHKSLKDPEYATAPQVLLSVVLLMNVAANLHDLESLRAHFSGLAALLSRQPTLHTENHLTRRLLNSWAFSYASAVGHFGLPDFLQFDARVCAVKADPIAGTALGKLHKQGYLSSKFYRSLPNLFLLRPLLDLAVKDQISPPLAADLLRCVWTGSLAMADALPKCTTRLEKCCWFALTINFLSDIEHCARENLAGVSALLCSQLRKSNIEQSITVAPEFVLWVSFTARSLLTNRAEVIWLSQVIAKSSKALNIKHYVEARIICETFFWSPYIDRLVSLVYPGGGSGGGNLEDQTSAIEYADALGMIDADARNNIASPAGGPCTLCMRQDCPCPLTKGADGELIDRMKHQVGMIWSTVDGFRKVCDQPWAEDVVEGPSTTVPLES